MKVTATPERAEVAIVTILPEAYEAVCRIFSLSEYDTREGYQWTWGRTSLGTRAVVVVTGLPLDRENIAAATFVGRMLDAWSPEHLLLVDMGGAVRGRDNVRLGDVITHTILHYYDYHKVGERGMNSPRYLPLQGASTFLRELSRRAKFRGDVSWIDKIFVKRPGGGVPRVLEGEMLVGGAILSDGTRLRKLLKDYPKVLAVEMEGVGVGRAVLDYSTRGQVPEFLILRGMSDYCNVPQRRNQATRDRWRRYAAATAAAHAYALVCEMADSPAESIREVKQLRKDIRCNRPVDNLWEATRVVLRGRDREVQRLIGLFSERTAESVSSVPHVIWGEAGMGKSVLAREITAHLAPRYAIRWWVDASDQFKIRLSLRQLAWQLGITSAMADLSSGGSDGTEAHRFLSDLRDFFDQGLLHGRVLIVLDNVDDAGLKRELPTTTLRYLPSSACDVLITSQSSRWYPVAVTETPLEGLEPATGVELIAFESGRPELAGNDDVRAICEIFGGRPLFLKQIAVLLRDGDDPKDFRMRVNESEENALIILPDGEGFEPIWRLTYGFSIDRADNARPGARNLLETMAFFAPEPIPLALLHATVESWNGWRIAHVDGVLATLVERSLLQRQRSRNNANFYALHRIVSAIVRTVVHEGDRLTKALSVAASALSHTIPTREILNQPEGQQIMALLAPHVEAVSQHVLAFKDMLPLPIREKAAEAASILGLYRRMLSEWTAAEDSSRKAVELSDPIREPGGAALRKVRLANIIRQRGFFDPSQELLNDSLPLLKEHGDVRDYAWALTVQARVLRHRLDTAVIDALPLLTEALRLLDGLDDDEDATTRRQLSELHGYLAVVNRQLSNIDAAEAESLEGLRIITGGAEPDAVLNASELPRDALIATHLRALGGVWRLRGDLCHAMYAQRQALNIFETVYGFDHVDILRCLDSLGRVQREWGDFEDAIESFSRAERISDLRFGRNHAHAGTAAVNRALVYLELQNAKKAFEEAEKGLGIYRVVYKEHGNEKKHLSIRNEATAWAIFVRATSLTELGDIEQAYNDHVSVLNWRNAHYPAVHALTASSKYALGDVLWRAGGDESQEAAVAQHREALAMREQVFGKMPNYWVAQSQARVGIFTRDCGLLKLAHATFTQQLKPGHWRIREVADAIRRLCDDFSGK